MTNTPAPNADTGMLRSEPRIWVTIAVTFALSTLATAASVVIWRLMQ